MPSPRILLIPTKHSQLLRLAYQKMQEARLMYEGITSLIVEEMLGDPDLEDIQVCDVVVDPERQTLTLTPRQPEDQPAETRSNVEHAPWHAVVPTHTPPSVP